MRKIRKDKDVPFLEVRTHGIKFPEWLWRLIGEGVTRKPAISSRTAWIIRAVINQAKRDKIYQKYNELFQKQIELEVKK